MRGHDALIAMRQLGMRPPLLSIDLLPAYTAMSAPVGGWQDGGPLGTQTAHVEVLPSDNVGRLDLRFAVGMPVLASGGEGDAKRLLALLFACQAAGASRVIAVIGRVDEWDMPRVVRAIDSAAENFQQEAEQWPV